jgi:hypothetical protein
VRSGWVPSLFRISPITYAFTWPPDSQNRVWVTTLTAVLLIDIPSHRLENHRIFQQLTTHWCPEREEHGYFLTPLFKCSTNPRVATAHRWMMVDVISKLDTPTGSHLSLLARWLCSCLLALDRMFLRQGRQVVLCGRIQGSQTR